MNGLLVLCEEHKLPLKQCIRAELKLQAAARVTLMDWCRYMKQVTGDPGCQVDIIREKTKEHRKCQRPALFWTKTPWGCSCTRRVCKKHSRWRKVAEDACTCRNHPPTIGRGRGGDPSPWQENAIRAMEGDS